MNVHIILTVSLLLPAGSGALLATEDDCNCDTFVRSTIDCRAVDWNNHAGSVVTSRDQLGRLLESMAEGSEEGITCFLNSPFARGCGCPPHEADIDSRDPGETDEFLRSYDCVERHAEPCIGDLLDSHYRMIREAPSAPVQWGSILVVFGAYMDLEAPDTFVKRLTDASRHVLSKSNDPTTDAVMLKMMGFYRFDDPEILEAILERMRSESALVRSLSYEVFYAYTKCPVMEQWSPESEPTLEQIDEVGRWWREHEDSFSGGNDS